MLILGTADKSPQLLEAAREPFLSIVSTKTAADFKRAFPGAKVFNRRNHSFAVKRDYESVRDFADILFPDKDLMTYRNGKRALTELLLDTTTPLHKLDGDTKDPAIAEALATVKDLLLSPVLKRVLTRRPNFDFSGSVIACLDGMNREDARILAALCIGQAKGHVLVEQFGLYGRPLHLSLIDEGRLTAGVTFLAQLPLSLQQALLTMPDKYGAGCTHEDALALADFSGFRPGTDGHSTFVEDRMTIPPNAR